MKKIFQNKRALLVLSLVFSVILWFVVVTQISPNAARTISGIPITINEEFTNVGLSGLSVIEGKDQKISVSVEGPRNLISKLTKDDFMVTPRTSNISDPGKYTVDLDIYLKESSSSIIIKDVSHKTVTLSFDRIGSITIRLETDKSAQSVPEGFILESPVINPEYLTVTGPSELLNRVSRAVVKMEYPEELTETIVTDAPVMLLDAENVEVKSDLLSLSVENAQVTLPLLKLKTLPLDIVFQNIPQGITASIIKTTIEPKQIDVAGPERVIDEMEKVILSEVDFKLVENGVVLSYDITLPSGVKNLQNIQKAEVKIELQGMGSRYLNIPNILVNNKPAEYDVVVHTQHINNVKIIGPVNMIETLSEEDFYAEVVVDADDLTLGKQEVPVRIVSVNYPGVWSFGDYKCIIEVIEKR